jgi:hypothetical protein
MEDKDSIEVRLWAYIDGNSDAAENEAVSALIAYDPMWSAHYEALLDLNAAILNGLELEQPPVRFTKNVMELVADVKIAPAINGYINPSIIKGIAAFFVISIVLVLGYCVSTINWHNTASALRLPDIQLPDMSRQYNNMFINIAIGVNVVLGLLLADMMLRKRDKKRQHQ